MVRMLEPIARAMRDERDDAEYRGVEIGGFVFGSRDGLVINITDFARADDVNTSTSRRVELDQSRVALMASQLRHAAEVLGDFHSHPGEAPPRSLELGHDVAAWAAQLARNRDTWVGLVITGHTLYAHEVHAYVARRDGARVLVECAEIAED
jgi:hypothetical protein